MATSEKKQKLEAATLRLIDAIPIQEVNSSHQSGLCGSCEASQVEDAYLREIAEDMATWPGMAENFLDGFDVAPNYDGDRKEKRSTLPEEHSVGTCLLKRALGQCSIYEANK